MAKTKKQKKLEKKAKSSGSKKPVEAPASSPKKGEFQTVRIPLKQIIDPPKYLIARDSLGNLDELRNSIKRDGQIQNLTVRPSKKAGVYELLCGHRRRAALVELKEKDALVTIRTDLTDDDRALGFIASENSADSRFDLAPMEQAKVFKRLFDSFGADSSAAGKVAKYCATTSNNVRRTMGLLDIPKDVRELIETGIVSKDAGIQFGRIADEKTKNHIRQGLVSGSIKTAPQIERAASDFINEQKAKGEKVDKPTDGRRVDVPKGSRSKTEINTVTDDLLWAYGVASEQIKDPTKTFDKIRGNKEAAATIAGQLSILWWISFELQGAESKPADPTSKAFKEHASRALSDLLAAQAQELNEDGSEVLSEEPPSEAKKRIAAEKKERREKRKAAWKAEREAEKSKKPKKEKKGGKSKPAPVDKPDEDDAEDLNEVEMEEAVEDSTESDDAGVDDTDSAYDSDND
jgi:ParB/RepB/Spo0J family partition protein